MTTLLIAEHDNAHLKDATTRRSRPLRRSAQPVHVLVAGANAKAAAEAAAKLDGRGEGASRRRALLTSTSSPSRWRR